MINGYKGVRTALTQHVLYYPTPINLKYSWSFGSLVGIFFALQLVTGIFLAMHYTANMELAFSSVVHIMVDVKHGWLIRYMHANGASVVFILLYCHIGRGLYYKSYRPSRRYTWWSGLVIFILMMATAFIGYVLPWGQMSFWGATVITSLVTAIPFVGEPIAHWVWGGFAISNATLVRFFSLHYLLPFVILGIVSLHLMVLHSAGSSEPSHSEVGEKLTFHPYYIYKDGFILAFCMLIFALLVFFNPNLLGHPDNFVKADPLVTPAHIVPEWYFTPFYAILRACPHKLGGVIGMGAALLVLFVLPFYQISSPAVPINMSLLHKAAFWVFALIFMFLMFLGGQAAAQPFVTYSRVFSFLYFVYFLIVLPSIPRLESWSVQWGSTPSDQLPTSAIFLFALSRGMRIPLLRRNARQKARALLKNKMRIHQARVKALRKAVTIIAAVIALYVFMTRTSTQNIIFHTLFILCHCIQGVILFMYKMMLPALIIVLSLAVVVLSNPIHTLLALIGTFFCIAVLLISVNIEFLSMILLIVYIGAVSILFLFVIMLFNLNSSGHLNILPAFKQSAYIYAFIVAPKFYFLFVTKLHAGVVTSIWLARRIKWRQNSAYEFPIHYKYTDVMIFALNLYTKESFFFILLGFMLLTSMLGAITLALSVEKK